MHSKPAIHPGQHIRYDCMEPLGLNVSEAAEVLGVSRPQLSRVLNGRSSISPEMAIRLSKAFGSTPAFWLRLQLNYDLVGVEEQVEDIQVERYVPPEPQLAT